MKGTPPLIAGIAAPADAEALLAEALRDRRLVFEVGIDEEFRVEVVRLAKVALVDHCRRNYTIAAKQFPALLVCAVAADAVFAYKAGDLWGQVTLEHGTGTEIGQAFTSAIALIGLEQFQVFDEQPAARYLSRILAHGGVPIYCLGDLFRLVLHARSRGVADALDVVETLQDGGTFGVQADRPVRRFLCETGAIGRDFLERVMELPDEADSVRSSEAIAASLGLPSYVVSEFRHLLPRLDVGKRSLSGSRVPRLCFDPDGEVPFVRLPTAASTPVQWVIIHEPAGEHLPISVEVQPDGGERSVAVGPATRWRALTCPVGSRAIESYAVRGPSGDRPTLAFDPATGAVVADARFSPSRDLVVLAPCELSTVGTDVSIVGHRTIGAEHWTGWVLHEVKIDGPGTLTGQVELEKVELRLGVDEQASIEFLNRVAGVTTADGLAVFSGAPQLAALPWSPAEAAKWSVTTSGKGIDTRSIDGPRDLTAVNKFLEESLAGRLLSSASIRLVGPVGASHRLSAAVVPALAIEVPADPLLPGDHAVATMTVADGISFTDSGSSSLTAGIDAGEPRLTVGVFTGETFAALKVRCPVLRWRLVTAAGAGSSLGNEPVHRTFHPEGSRSAMLVVDPAGALAPVTCWVSEGGSDATPVPSTGASRDGLLRFDLSSSVARVIEAETLTVTASLQVQGRTVPAVRLEESVSVALREIEYLIDGGIPVLGYRLAEGRTIPGRALQVASIDRPWSRPMIACVTSPTPAGRLECSRLKPGRYKARAVVQDGVGEARIPDGSQWVAFEVPWDGAEWVDDSREDERELLVRAVAFPGTVVPPLEDPSAAAPAAALLLGSRQCDREGAASLLAAIQGTWSSWAEALDHAAEHYGVDSATTVRAAVRVLANSDPGVTPPGQGTVATRLLRLAGTARGGALDGDGWKADAGVPPDEALGDANIVGTNVRAASVALLRSTVRAMRRLVAAPLSANGRARGVIEVRAWGTSTDKAERDWVTALVRSYSLGEADLAALPRQVRLACLAQRKWLECREFPDGAAVAVLHVTSFEAAAHVAFESPSRERAAEFLVSVAKTFPEYVESRLAYFLQLRLRMRKA